MDTSGEGLDEGLRKQGGRDGLLSAEVGLSFTNGVRFKIATPPQLSP